MAPAITKLMLAISGIGPAQFNTIINRALAMINIIPLQNAMPIKGAQQWISNYFDEELAALERYRKELFSSMAIRRQARQRQYEELYGEATNSAFTL